MSAILEDTEDMRVNPYDLPLDRIDVSRPELYESDSWRPWFRRLRDEAPVHWCEEGVTGSGGFWSITRFDDIVAVDKDHERFSSEPSITLADPRPDLTTSSFIAMDRPRHDAQRKSVQGVVAPRNLARLEPLIRQRAAAILDNLPVGEPFNWVEQVSKELTTRMLATIFDFPFEDRHLLPYWSDVATTNPVLTGASEETMAQRRETLLECLAYFTRLWNERVNAEPGNDLISMLAHNPATREMEPMQYLGNLILLIVGGNDTTRNSISGGVLALNQNPDQYAKLRANPGLIDNMVPEIIRWQTPLTYMRRTANVDVLMHDQTIRAGDKVLMWYLSGNRDERVIDDPDAFEIERANARHHVSFGFGIHRCMGNRLGEMQLRVLWEEILKRFHTIELVGEPVRVRSNFVRGFAEMPVVVQPH